MIQGEKPPTTLASTERSTLLPAVSDTASQLWRKPAQTFSNIASEIIQGYPYQAAPAEIWSLGVLLAILLTGVPPFDSPQSAANGDIRLKRPQAISYEALDLIKKCLNLDVANRITIEGVKRHRWLTSVGLRDGKGRSGHRPAEPMGFRPVAHDGHRHGHE